MSLNGGLWIISKYATPNKYSRHFGLGKALVRKGVDVTLICSVSNSVAPHDVPKFRGWKKEENHDGLKVIWLNGPEITSNGIVRIFSWFWFELKVILTLWRKPNHPEAILASSLSLLSVWSGIILARKHKARFSFEVRDIWPLSLVELSGVNPKNPLIRFLGKTERLGYKKAHTIIGSMPNLVEHVREITPENVDKVICVPQGVNLSVFEEGAKKLPSDYVDTYFSDSSLTVAYTGTLNANNPIDTLIEAAQTLHKEGSKIKILILGTGNNKEKYQDQVKDNSNISFPPVIAKEEMADFLSRVDVGYDAFSSEMARFGLSRNKWIDYMYNRCIIVCSYDGYQSMVNESESGFFVPFGDVEKLVDTLKAIEKMDAEQRDQMGVRARAFIKANHQFDRLADLYNSHL